MSATTKRMSETAERVLADCGHALITTVDSYSGWVRISHLLWGTSGRFLDVDVADEVYAEIVETGFVDVVAGHTVRTTGSRINIDQLVVTQEGRAYLEAHGLDVDAALRHM